MIWIFVAIIFAIAWGIWSFKDRWDFGVRPCVVKFFFGLWLAALVFPVGNLVSGLICEFFAETEPVLVATTEIEALNDSSAASGRFFLGSGHSDEGVKYYYIVETEKGKHIESIDADNAYIIESNDGTPRIEKYRYDWVNDAVEWIAIGPLTDFEYQIFVPENSVTNEFTVDLED